MSEQVKELPMRTETEAAAPDSAGTGKTLVSIASVLGAVASLSCCVIPFALFFLGLSGAWVSNLTALAPYKPIFVASTLGFLGVGFFLVYRKPKVACADGSYCARPSSNRIAKIGLWTATVLVLVATTFSYWAPLLVST
jgi:mercuric ion transport protein